MAASEDNIILEIFLNGCFSKTAAKIYLSKEVQYKKFYIGSSNLNLLDLS